MRDKSVRLVLESLQQGVPDGDHLPHEDPHEAVITPRVPGIVPPTVRQVPVPVALHPTPGPETAPMGEIAELQARLGSALQQEIDSKSGQPVPAPPVVQDIQPILPRSSSAVLDNRGGLDSNNAPPEIRDPYVTPSKIPALSRVPEKISPKPSPPKAAPESRPVIAPNPQRSPKKNTDNTPWLVRGVIAAALMAAFTLTSRSCKKDNMEQGIGNVLEMADININRRLQEELAALENAPGVPETKKYVVLSGTDPGHPIKLYPGYFTNTVTFESARPNPIGISFSHLHSNPSNEAYIFYEQNKKTFLLVMNNDSSSDPCSCSGKGCLECIDKYSGNDNALLRLKYTLIEGQLDENGNVISAKHRPLVKSVREGQREVFESQLNLGMFKAPDKSEWQPLLIPEALQTLNKLHHLYIAKKNQPKEERIDGPKPIKELPITIPPRFTESWERQRFIALVRSPHLCPRSGGRCLDCRPNEDGKPKSPQYTQNRMACANAAAERVDFEIRNRGLISLGGDKVLNCRDRANKPDCDQYWQDRSHGKPVVDDF